MALTPEQIRKRNDLIDKMRKNWQINTQTKEITRIKRPICIKFWHWLIRKRYSVKDLYIYVYELFFDKRNMEQLIIYPFPFDHDNIKKPMIIPTIFKLDGGWNIPTSDLKVLVKGPLISEDGSQVLVSKDTKWHAYWGIILRIIAVLGIIVTVREFIKILIELF